MTTKLYHHKTDGGAEYLCTSAVSGTDEGDLHTAIIRLDGGPELLNPSTAAAPELLKALSEIVDVAYSDPRIINLIGRERFNAANAAIQKAEG